MTDLEIYQNIINNLNFTYYDKNDELNGMVHYFYLVASGKEMGIVLEVNNEKCRIAYTDTLETESIIREEYSKLKSEIREELINDLIN